MRYRAGVLGVSALTLSVLLGGLAIGAAGADDPSPAPNTWPGQESDCTGHVALTFDDGPTDATPAVLNVLREHGARATFFATGSAVAEKPELAERIVAEGHELGNHSYDHPFMDELPQEAMQRNIAGASDLIEKVVGVRPSLFRPPFGRTSAEIAGAAARTGHTEVLWTVDTGDYIESGDLAVNDYRAVVGLSDAVAPGDVILMHDVVGSPAAAALEEFLQRLQARGLCTGQLHPSAAAVTAWEGQVYFASVGPWTREVAADPCRTSEWSRLVYWATGMDVCIG